MQALREAQAKLSNTHEEEKTDCRPGQCCMNRIKLHGEISYSFEFVDAEDDLVSNFPDNDWLPSPVEKPPFLETGFSGAFSCNNYVPQYAQSIRVGEVKCFSVLFREAGNSLLPEIAEDAQSLAVLKPWSGTHWAEQTL